MFGGVLATDRVLPGLPVALPGDGQFPFWELTTLDAPHSAIGHSASVTPRGAQPYGNGVAVTLGLLGDDAAEIVIADTGRFTLDAAGRRIHHVAPAAVDRSAVALDMIGMILPFAMHRGGAWCVHASAVQTRGGAIAFVAPRGTGKSTLATACVQAGCPLVADDVVVLRRDADGVTVTPAGVPLRLRVGTAQQVGVSTGFADAWGKVRVDGPLATVASPLAAIYVLAPAPADAPVARATRPTRAAALALLANGKITELLGADPDGAALTRCVAIAHQVPAFDLAVPRAIGRLQDVTDALMAWHGGPAQPVVPHDA